MVNAAQDAGLPPDPQAYNILIKGYARAGLLSLLPDLIADMQLEVSGACILLCRDSVMPATVTAAVRIVGSSAKRLDS